MNAYRKDIDGLRAIAILLVLFYHLGISFIQAGFIGVDVFFVISGFLITQHIINDIQQGGFSLKRFYLKRMRRILPALVFVLLIVSIIAYLMLLPDALESYSKTMLAALLSASNLYFYEFIKVGYFGTDATVLPLLHTWSLGVEEQFYIFWPLLLLVLFSRFSKRGVLVCSCVFFMGSFFFYYFFRGHAIAVFYLPVFRAFELLMGAILAIIWEWAGEKPYGIIDDFLSLLGLSLIIYSGCFLNGSDYPSLYSLLPCLGAVMLIYTGRRATPIGNKLLSFKPLVLVGVISYSLYLWHWPLIAYIHSLNITINFKLGVGICLLSFILSYLSWYFIEQPFRFKFKFRFIKTLLLFFFIPLVLAIAFIFFLSSHSYAGFNAISPQVYQKANDFIGPLSLEGDCGDVLITPDFKKVCSIGDLGRKQSDVLIVGDSHAMAYGGLLTVILENSKLKGDLITHSGTPFILGNINDWRDNKPMEMDRVIAKVIAERHYKYVVIAGYWNYYPNSIWGKNVSANNDFSIFDQGLGNAVQAVENAGSIPVIMFDVPPLLNVSQYCGFTKLSKFYNCYNNKNLIFSIQAQTRAIILSLKERHKNIILVDPTKVICNQNKCFSSLSGVALYYTNGTNSHLNYTGSHLIGQLYLKQYGNPFLNSSSNS